MHHNDKRISLWLEDALAAGALILLLCFAPPVVLALERSAQQAPKTDHRATATHYAGIIAQILTKPTVITVNGENAATCRPLKGKS